MLHIREDPCASQMLCESTVVLEAMTKAFGSAQQDLLRYRQCVMLDTAMYGLKRSLYQVTNSELASRQLLNTLQVAGPEGLLCIEATAAPVYRLPLGSS